MIRLPLISALAAATLLTGFATAASAADYDGDYRGGHSNNTRTEQPAAQYGQKRVPNDYDEDNYRPRHHDHGWQRPGHGQGYIRSVQARASYSSDYLPFHVQEWRARREAIENWKAKVASSYGQQFAHWRMAQDKNVDCNARRGSVDCTVSARPVQGGYGGWGGRWGWNNN